MSPCFTLFIFGRPCHLYGFTQCSGDPHFSLRTACLFSFGKMNISESGLFPITYLLILELLSLNCANNILPL